MKFYNRTQELEILRRTWVQSKQSACFTVMIGRRRIGKTSLLLESVKGTKYLYLFVSCTSEPLLCQQFQKDAAEHWESRYSERLPGSGICSNSF